jgi:hypothetical protein
VIASTRTYCIEKFQEIVKMCDHSSIKKSSNPILEKEKLSSTQNVLPLQNLVIELDEGNEESLLGGSWTGEDTLRPRLNAPDESARTVVSYYGIRSIPTLM